MNQPTPDINNRLSILYDLLLTNESTLQKELISLIRRPELIEDPSSFALLLVKLRDTIYVSPLLEAISEGDKNDEWLRSLMHAAAALMEECSEEDEIDNPPGLADRLEDWLLNGRDELAWKAAMILKFHESEWADKIRLKKLEQEDFFLVHVECLTGLLRSDKNKYIHLLKDIAADEAKNANLRKWCNETIMK